MWPCGHTAHNESIFKGPRSLKSGFSPDSKHRQPVIQGIEHSPKNTTCDQEGVTCKNGWAVPQQRDQEGTGEDGLWKYHTDGQTEGLFLKGFAFLSGKRL